MPASEEPARPARRYVGAIRGRASFGSSRSGARRAPRSRSAGHSRRRLVRRRSAGRDRAASRSRRSQWPGGTRRPLSPSTTTSGRPPTAKAMTGLAAARASMAARPRPSDREGINTRSMAGSRRGTSARRPRNRTCCRGCAHRRRRVAALRGECRYGRCAPAQAARDSGSLSARARLARHLPRHPSDAPGLPAARSARGRDRSGRAHATGCGRR